MCKAWNTTRVRWRWNHSYYTRNSRRSSCSLLVERHPPYLHLSLTFIFKQHILRTSRHSFCINAFIPWHCNHSFHPLPRLLLHSLLLGTFLSLYSLLRTLAGNTPFAAPNAIYTLHNRSYTTLRAIVFLRLEDAHHLFLRSKYLSATDTLGV
jgi:hypothetical protein